ncbi:mitochondrial 2-oxoglutarate/malate carrier protein-like isoform X1 [Drosophila ficusphila]|uniref:mitochondrial 2-oxoglutarate/malate carrier protein-like isoform X1 n=1 Tax=Drosophila ficusphila TaxID=30025 RepID=UPI001C893AEF|nr:mitochondrial 2-oxoglutarate/malate carrier protein-like isoform X1 [Drosophila ficusphila]
MPTVGRSMVVNMLQFGSYSQLKGLRPEYFSGLSLQISAAMLTSVLTTMASMLLDMAKTRIQQQKTGEYKGIFDVLMKVSKNEGIFALWKGFTPYLLRRGLNIVFADFFTEQLTKAYKRYVLELAIWGNGIAIISNLFLQIRIRIKFTSNFFSSGSNIYP